MKLATLSLLTLVSLSSPPLAYSNQACFDANAKRAIDIMNDIEDLSDEMRGTSPGSQRWRMNFCTKANKLVRYTSYRVKAAECIND